MSGDRCYHCDFGVFLDLWNAIQNQQTPTIHFRIARWLQRCWERGEKRLLLQAFRASGKSTIVGIFIAWILCRDPDLRILVLSAESILAQKMVRTIRKLIEQHPLTAHLRPSNPDQWAADSFTVTRRRLSRDPSVLARGLYANTTGTRADVIICDDVEVPNTCDTPEKREKLRERLCENDFILTPDGTQLYIGTPHNYYSIYTDRPRKEIGETEIFLKDYHRLSIPLIRRNGACNWPERYPPEEVERMRRHSGPARFASQMLLQPVNIKQSRFNPALLNIYGDDLDYHEVHQTMVLSIGGRKIVSASAWWDPSFGKVGGDSSVLAVIYTDEEGNYFLHRVAYITANPTVGEDEARLQCRQVAQIAKDLFLPSIAVETNGLGKFLPSILRQELAKARVPCAVVEKISRRAKDIRILEAFDAVMAARALHVHESVYRTPFITEMQDWRPDLRSEKDDGLDAAAGALSLEPVRLKRIYGDMHRLWKPVGQSHTARTEFDV